MKKNYQNPEARFVDINVKDPLLEPPVISEPLANEGGWESNYDKFPTSKSVWGEDEETEE